ncbi:hypothetical protein GCM10011399_06010 [Subtercola lobariae]|uniref:Uncharacterized protein n=1 Tax=Subtercola lobariae TaxID=1588641 RepID=A0A917B310_9MICO|nr:hypothetical protein GCM10011399_06010 [Subtercola lobariae]
MQLIQRAVHRLIGAGSGMHALSNPPTALQRAFLRTVMPLVRPRAARMVGYGFRPETVDESVLRVQV